MELHPPLHLGVVGIEKEAFGLPSTMVTNFTYNLENALYCFIWVMIFFFVNLLFNLFNFRWSQTKHNFNLFWYQALIFFFTICSHYFILFYLFRKKHIKKCKRSDKQIHQKLEKIMNAINKKLLFALTKNFPSGLKFKFVSPNYVFFLRGLIS